MFNLFKKQKVSDTVGTEMEPKPMQSKLIVTARDASTWEEAKPILIAALLKTTGAKRVTVRETYLKIEIELPFMQACRGLDMLLHHFKKEYKGIPLNFSLQVNATQQWQ